MQKTQHFHLNQWALNDLVRMDDFNADNLTLDNALAGLSGQIAAMPSQGDLDNALAGLSGQIAALPSQDDLDEVRSSLEDTKQQIQSNLLKYTPISNPKLSYSQGAFFLNFSGLDLEDYAVICLTLAPLTGSTQLYHLKPRYKSGANQASLLTSYGSSPVSGAIAVVPLMCTTTVLLFPLGSAGNGGVLGGVSFGNTGVGIGSTGTMLSNLSGFELAAASGTTDSSARITVELSGLK